MNQHETNDTDIQLDELLAHARQRRWTGPDHSSRVDLHLEGITMNQRNRLNLSRNALVMIGVGALTAGSLGAAVTHKIMSRTAVFQGEDGSLYEVRITEMPSEATGQFIADDGTVYHVQSGDSDGATGFVSDTEGQPEQPHLHIAED